jgi:hypothetical protein
VRHAASAPGGRRGRRGRRRAQADPAAAGSRAAARPRLGQLPYLLVLGGTGLSLLSIRQGEQDVQSGTLELAGVLLAAAVARLLLPERRAGLLGSRQRLADVAAFAALGIGLLVAGLVFPPPV